MAFAAALQVFACAHSHAQQLTTGGAVGRYWPQPRFLYLAGEVGESRPTQDVYVRTKLLASMISHRASASGCKLAVRVQRASVIAIQPSPLAPLAEAERGRCAREAVGAAVDINGATDAFEQARAALLRLFAPIERPTSMLFGTTRVAYREIYKAAPDVMDLLNVATSSISTITFAEFAAWHRDVWPASKVTVHVTPAATSAIDAIRSDAALAPVHLSATVPAGRAFDTSAAALFSIHAKTSGNVAPRRVNHAILVPVIWSDEPNERISRISQRFCGERSEIAFRTSNGPTARLTCAFEDLHGLHNWLVLSWTPPSRQSPNVTDLRAWRDLICADPLVQEVLNPAIKREGPCGGIFLYDHTTKLIQL